jgi:hypothetical protein
LYGVLLVGAIISNFIIVIVVLGYSITIKNAIIGTRKAGQYAWDKSNYCQRWQCYLSLSLPFFTDCLKAAQVHLTFAAFTSNLDLIHTCRDQSILWRTSELLVVTSARTCACILSEPTP